MSQQNGDRRRWDTDDRYRGVADASAFAPPIDELAALARRPYWVAEEPDAHLVPHLREAGAQDTAATAAGLRLVRTTSGADGVLTAELEHPAGASNGDIRRQAFAFIAAIAEPATSVREHRDGDQVRFDIVTGIPDDVGPFASHGHAIRLIVRQSADATPA